MTQRRPRISVIIITYNQEDVIDRTLNSLLGQDCLYEICVSDDCSRDRTWEILNGYSDRYPGVFKLHRNDPNIGIFANEEQTWGMPTGDIVYRIAGDDVCCENYFRKVVEFIDANGIDWENELFCIVGNNIVEYPEGRRDLIRNDIVRKGYPALKLKMRALLNDRSACFSRKVLQKYIPVSKGRSFVVEEAQDDQLELFAEKFYYVDAPGNIYYPELGASSRLTPEDMEERVSIFGFFEEFLASTGHELDSHDKSYVRYKTAFLRYKCSHRLSDLVKASWHYLGSIDPSLGIHTINFEHLFLALRRKLERKWKSR